MKESKIEKHLVKLCHDNDWLCQKFTSPGLRGVPDRLVILPRGRIAFVELKTKSGKLSPHQIRRHVELWTKDHIVKVLSSIEEVELFVFTLQEQYGVQK